MQEEVDEKTMALVISGGKISAGILKDATVYMKENVARRAAQLVSSGELDSVSVIDAVEKATGFKIKDQA